LDLDKGCSGAELATNHHKSWNTVSYTRIYFRYTRILGGPVELRLYLKLRLQVLVHRIFGVIGERK